MRIRHEPPLVDTAAQTLLALAAARKSRPCGPCLGLQYRGLIVDKCVDRIRSPDGDGLGARRWEDFNRRLTIYLPLDVRAELEEEAQRSGLSKTRIVVAALRSHLDALPDE